MMKCLYKAKGDLNPTCSKSHIRYSFYIQESYDSIKVRFKYAPKNVEDKDLSKKLVLESLKKYGYLQEGENTSEKNLDDFLPLQNHITISIDDPEGFRGATHRHDFNLELVLNEKESTPGLETRANALGMWDITLDLHALISEDCTYCVEVWGD